VGVRVRVRVCVCVGMGVGVCVCGGGRAGGYATVAPAVGGVGQHNKARRVAAPCSKPCSDCGRVGQQRVWELQRHLVCPTAGPVREWSVLARESD
jgi:hypothetical protein